MAQETSQWREILGKTYCYGLEEVSESYDQQHIIPYKTVSCFPWSLNSLNDLWSSEMASQPDKVEHWRQTISRWSGAIAAGGGRTLRLFTTWPGKGHRPLLRVNLTDPEGDISCIAWCLVVNSDGFRPLIAFSGNRIIYLLNAENGEYHGVLSGHGGRVNHLEVIPSDPSYLISASDDYSCRIYDLGRSIEGEVLNPRWPGSSKMAMAGPPFGLRSNISEGKGLGRCVAILAGGPSGGHLAPVKCATFHPFFSLVATCGADHAVKIWRIPDLNKKMIVREEKPLFSSTHVHSAPVLSIMWANEADMLISSSDDIIIRDHESRALRALPGTIVLWRWLSLDRFFPPILKRLPERMRCIAADFQESSSYKVISKYKLPPPLGAVRPSFYHSNIQSILIALPSKSSLRLSSVELFRPVKPPVFPFDDQGDLKEGQRAYINNDFEGDQVTVLPCIDIDLKQMANGACTKLPERVTMTACAFGEDGRLLVGVSKEQGLFIWRMQNEKSVS